MCFAIISEFAELFQEGSKFVYKISADIAYQSSSALQALRSPGQDPGLAARPVMYLVPNILWVPFEMS